MKTYVKPELYFESFELSQHIAACDLRLEHGMGQQNCAVNPHKDGSSPFFGSLETEFAGAFIDSTMNCTQKCEVYCYTNGAGSLPRPFQS